MGRDRVRILLPPAGESADRVTQLFQNPASRLFMTSPVSERDRGFESRLPPAARSANRIIFSIRTGAGQQARTRRAAGSSSTTYAGVGCRTRCRWSVTGRRDDPRDRRMPVAHRASALPRSQGAQPTKQGTRRPPAGVRRPRRSAATRRPRRRDSQGFPFGQFLSDTCGIGGAGGSTKPAAAMRARTGQGRDRLPNRPHPVWSSIQFAIGCHSDLGSRRSCHTPVR